MQRIKVLLLLAIVMAVAACDRIAQPTGDSANDASSAQNQLPSFAAYTSTDAENVKDALARALQVGSIGTGNLISAALIERLNTVADCLGNVGALAGRVYSSVNPPAAGLLVLVNNERMANNFLSCALNPSAQAQTEGRQAVEPCASNGTYTDPANGVSYTYIYVATDPSMCGAFEGWLGTKQRP
jgi:hypothetical protein